MQSQLYNTVLVTDLFNRQYKYGVVAVKLYTFYIVFLTIKRRVVMMGPF